MGLSPALGGRWEGACVCQHVYILMCSRSLFFLTLSLGLCDCYSVCPYVSALVSLPVHLSPSPLSGPGSLSTLCSCLFFSKTAHLPLPLCELLVSLCLSLSISLQPSSPHFPVSIHQGRLASPLPSLPPSLLSPALPLLTPLPPLSLPLSLHILEVCKHLLEWRDSQFQT